MFPIVLKLDGYYYDVTGIQDNEYQKTEIPGEVYTLVKSYDRWITDIPIRDWMYCELWFTTFKSGGGNIIGGNKSVGTGRQFRLINVTDTKDTVYIDYMSRTISGTSDNRIYKRVDSGTNATGVDLRTEQQDITYYCKVGAKKNLNGKDRTFFEISSEDNGYYLYQQSSDNVYGANNVRPNDLYFTLGCWNSNHALCATFYRCIFYDEFDNIVGNVRWKKVNNEWILYNFDTPCQKQHSDGDIIAFEDKTMYFPPYVSEYYEVSGTITDGSDTFERLVNNKTGIVLKGIKIES